MARHGKTRRCTLWRLISVILVIGALYAVLLLATIFIAGWHDDLALRPAKADVIIVLGAAQANGRPMGVLQGRLDHALTLYHQGFARHMLFTGGNRPGDLYTEAEAGRRYVRRHGVADRAILLEPNGRTTSESLRACREIMREHHLKTAILVSDPFHAFRLRCMARDIGLTAYVSPTPHSRVRSLSNRLYYSVREVGVFTAYRIFGV